MHILIEIQPLNLSSGARESVRVASAQDRRITGLNSVVWVPAIVQTPVLTIRLFDGDFGSSVQPGTATFSMNLAEVEKTYPNAYAYLWAGAPVSIYAEEPGTAWPWTRRFVGKVSRFEKESSRLQLVAEVDTAALGKDVLSLTYAGTTGIEGGDRGARSAARRRKRGGEFGVRANRAREPRARSREPRFRPAGGSLLIAPRGGVQRRERPQFHQRRAHPRAQHGRRVPEPGVHAQRERAIGRRRASPKRAGSVRR